MGDIFADDALESRKASEGSHTGIAGMFRENSLAGVLLSGGDAQCWLLPYLRQPGPGREVVTTIFRRMYSAVLDSGMACSDKHAAPTKDLGRRVSVFVVAQLLAL